MSEALPVRPSPAAAVRVDEHDPIGVARQRRAPEELRHALVAQLGAGDGQQEGGAAPEQLEVPRRHAEEDLQPLGPARGQPGCGQDSRPQEGGEGLGGHQEEVGAQAEEEGVAVAHRGGVSVHDGAVCMCTLVESDLLRSTMRHLKFIWLLRDR